MHLGVALQPEQLGHRDAARPADPAQVIAHVVIGSAFAAAWFTLVTLALALIGAVRGEGFGSQAQP